RVAEASSGNGVIVCHYIVEATKIVFVEREFDLGGGKKQVQRFQVPETVREIRQVRVVVKDAQISTAAGQRLEGNELWKRVKPGDVVVVSADGGMIDPAFLRVLTRDTLVIVTPRQPGPPMAPPPVPLEKKN